MKSWQSFRRYKMSKGPISGKTWSSKKRAVIGRACNDKAPVDMIEFESAGKAAQWIINNGLSKTERRQTVASAITSTIKGREQRKSQHKDGRVMVRNEAYGFHWEYK